MNGRAFSVDDLPLVLYILAQQLLVSLGNQTVLLLINVVKFQTQVRNNTVLCTNKEITDLYALHNQEITGMYVCC